MADDYPEDMIEGKTDSRGRLHLGTDYKNSKVKVAVLEVEEEDDDE